MPHWLSAAARIRRFSATSIPQDVCRKSGTRRPAPSPSQPADGCRYGFRWIAALPADACVAIGGEAAAAPTIASPFEEVRNRLKASSVPRGPASSIQMTGSRCDGSRKRRSFPPEAHSCHRAMPRQIIRATAATTMSANARDPILLALARYIPVLQQTRATERRLPSHRCAHGCRARCTEAKSFPAHRQQRESMAATPTRTCGVGKPARNAM